MVRFTVDVKQQHNTTTRSSSYSRISSDSSSSRNSSKSRRNRKKIKFNSISSVTTSVDGVVAHNSSIRSCSSNTYSTGRL